MAVYSVPGVSTLQMTLSYFDDAATRPTTGTGTQLGRINGIGEISVDPEQIDASALEDTKTQYVKGRDSVSDQWNITVNTQPETIAEWAALKGLTKWFKVSHPTLGYSYWVRGTVPQTLPLSPVDQNSLLTMELGITVVDVGDWVANA